MAPYERGPPNSEMHLIDMMATKKANLHARSSKGISMMGSKCDFYGAEGTK